MRKDDEKNINKILFRVTGALFIASAGLAGDSQRSKAINFAEEELFVQPKSSLLDQTCNSNADCPTGTLCSDKARVCVRPPEPKPSVGQSCSASSDCRAGEACSNSGVCIFDPGLVDFGSGTVFGSGPR
ncbi:hypothetical protein A2210_00125 [Candidatus Woesebacteria bacterium RIFOXYA1_FULL_40_18]|uniref:Dickkopf N-terminal cysteine-rich domain-containing protein n=1 Tax=Candidatus Woesebacteria bacterium RIFOXYA1_FULL_40_18 TaxID=1802532 RepID=A0A1F8CKZ4_9BACT|nr:MAG: hypothetical protein A2210_00125 [Candidatus Woesebacteria bacterium RIFOXYA1_FULL_40_18]